MLAPFVITFREGLEAALIIAIIVAYLTKINKPGLKKYAWGGVALALVLSVLIGAAVLATYGALEGVAEQLFEGIAALLATVVLTSMIFWMAKNSKDLKGNLQKKIDTAITKKYMIGLFLIAFIAVFREGIETVLFLTASFSLDFTGTIIGMVIGFALTIFLAFLLLKGTVKLPLQKFFKYTSILLIIFAAGLFGFGIHEMMEVGESNGYDFGFWGEHTYDINPSDSNDLLHEKGFIGSVFKALVGYDGNPENLRVIGYLLYWLIIGAYFLRVYHELSFRDILRSKLGKAGARKYDGITK